MKWYIFINVLILFFSCKPSIQIYCDDSEMTTITLSQNNVVSSKDIVADIEIIPLDSKELIGSIDNIIITDDHFVISDLRILRSVFIFDRRGILLATINRFGRGPQEYMSMTHVTLTPDNNLIVVYDNQMGKLLYFTLDGEFVASKSTGFWFSKIEYIDDDHMICTTYGEGKSDPGLKKYHNNNDLIYYTDSVFNIEKSFFPLNYSKNRFRIVTPNLSKHRGQIYVNPIFSDSIYVVEHNTLKAWYLIDMKKINGVANFASRITDEEFSALRKNNATFSGHFTDSDDFLLLSITTPPDSYLDYYFYSKNSGKVFFMDKMRFRPENLFFDGVALAKASHKDKLISVIQPYSILRIMSEETRHTIPELANITKDSNPIIVIYTLKENI